MEDKSETPDKKVDSLDAEKVARLKKLKKRAEALSEEFSTRRSDAYLYNSPLFAQYSAVLSDAKELGFGNIFSGIRTDTGVFSTASVLRILISEINTELDFSTDELKQSKHRIQELEQEIKVLTSSRRIPRPENPYEIPDGVLSSFPELAKPYLREAEACYNFGFYRAAAAMLGNAFEETLNSYFDKKGWEKTKVTPEGKKQLSYNDKCVLVASKINDEEYRPHFEQLLKFNSYHRGVSNHPSNHPFNEHGILAIMQNIIQINAWMNKN